MARNHREYAFPWVYREIPRPLIRLACAAFEHRREQYAVRDDLGLNVAEHSGHVLDGAASARSAS